LPFHVRAVLFHDVILALSTGYFQPYSSSPEIPKDGGSGILDDIERTIQSLGIIKKRLFWSYE